MCPGHEVGSVESLELGKPCGALGVWVSGSFCMSSSRECGGSASSVSGSGFVRDPLRNLLKMVQGRRRD